MAKSIYEKLFAYLTILLAIFPLLGFGIRSIVTILWSIIGIILFIKLQSRINNFKKDILYFTIPYVALLGSLIYSENVDYGLHTLVKMLSFLLIPSILYLNRDFFNKKQVDKVFLFFSISVVVLIFYQIIEVIINLDFITQNITSGEIKANGYREINEIKEDAIQRIKLRRFRNFVIKTTKTHTTYQGLWIALSVFFLVKMYYKKRSKIIGKIMLFCVIVLLFWLYLISARMPLIALIIGSAISVMKFSSLPKKTMIRIGLIFIIFIGISVSFKNPVSVRVKEYLKTGLSILNKSSKTKDFNSSNVRNGIYYCSYKVIKQHPFIGVGIGDIQDELDKCYKENIGAKVYTWNTYNSHNQYSFFWISSGLIGLLSFLLLVFHCFKKAFKYNNQLLFFFSIIISIIFMTENILERSDGVIFFSLFSALLLFNLNSKHKRIE